MKIRKERKKKDQRIATPMGNGRRPGGEIGLPEDVRVMHAEEHNPHDG